VRSLNSEPNVFVSAAVPYSLRQQIVALANRDGVTLSEEVRRSLALLLESHASERSNDKIAVA
jgi:hypothetical protein